MATTFDDPETSPFGCWAGHIPAEEAPAATDESSRIAFDLGGVAGLASGDTAEMLEF